MDRTLYVVGNGFDLGHGIHSKYSDFRKFCSTDYPDLCSRIDECLSGIEDDWSNFETALGSQNVNAIKKYADHNHESNKDYPVGIDDNELKHAFRDWIVAVNEEIKIKTQNGGISRKDILKDDGYFLSFNYTYTLEKIYGIASNKIMHIHGYVDLDDYSHKDDAPFLSLIYGHNKELSEIYVDADDFTRREYIETVSGFKKDFQESRLEDWLKTKNISSIVVMGHSMSEIDEVYYARLSALYPKASWIVYVFDKADQEKKERRCRELSLNVSNFAGPI